MAIGPEKAPQRWPVITAALTLGTILGFVVGDDTDQVSRILNVFSGEHAADWVGALGAILAASVAVGVGISQHKETQNALNKQIERDSIGPATASYWRLGNIINKIHSIECKMHADLFIAGFKCLHHRPIFAGAYLDDITKQIDVLRSEVQSGKHSISAALAATNAAFRALTASPPAGGANCYACNCEFMTSYNSVKEARKYLEMACDIIAKEYPSIRANVAGMPDHFQHHSPSNNGTSAAG